jgi:hypothetical protein
VASCAVVARVGSLLAFGLVALVFAGVARADADPASDTLYQGRVFLPLETRVSPALAQRLAADALAAEQAGRPIRVALIATRTDLGGVASLYGRPTEYARFLDSELQFVYQGQVLVVMPQGSALAERGRLVANAAVVNAVVGRGGDGLVRTAIALVEKLSGVKAPPGLTAPSPPTTTAPRHVLPTAPVQKRSKGGIPVWASALIAVGAVGFLLAPALALVRRRRRRVFTPTSPDPDDPYRYRGP